MKCKLLFLLVIGILLVLPMAFADIESELIADLIFSYEPEGDTVTDSSVYDNTGTATGDPEFVDAGGGVTSTRFDGNDYVTFSTIPVYTTCINCSFYWWPNATASGQLYLGSMRTGTTEGEWKFRIDSNVENQFELEVWTSAGYVGAYVSYGGFLANSGYELVGITITQNSTTLTTVSIWHNYTKLVTATSAGSFTGPTKDLILAADAAGSEPYIGGIKGSGMINHTINQTEWTFLHAQGENYKLGVAVAPTFSGNQRNVTIPLTDDFVRFDINITSSDNVTWYAFSTDNGTGDQFYNLSFIELPGNPTIANVTYNITIYNESGVTWQWKWFANDSNGIWGVSSVYSLIVGGTTPSNVTMHSNNFFNDQNTTYINLPDSKTALLNFSLTDDIDVYGFELFILDPNGITSYNWTNSSMGGVITNFSKTVNVSSFSEINGIYTVNITAWDSHTALTIPDYKVDIGKNYLLFDDSIRISADDALTAKAIKKRDKYNFEFTYRDWLTPKTKVFYVESINALTYKTVGYKAHFVDWEEKKWIDFEGIEGEPRVIKINDYKYRIEYATDAEKVVFNSIGGLNSESYFYKYYLVNPSLNWTSPTTAISYFTNNSISVVLNVTSQYRNTTQFRLYNSSKDLIDSLNVTNSGTGSYFYNATFSSLTEDIYYINASHLTVTNLSTNTTTLTFSIAALNISFYDEVTEVLITDKITLDVVGDDYAQNYSTTTGMVGVTGWVGGEYRLSYVADKYDKRTYFYNLGNATNYSISLYLLSSGNSTTVNLYLTDLYANPLINYYVYLMRYFVSSNSYKTVELIKTDENGMVQHNVILDTAYYRWMFKDPGKTLIKTTTGQPIYLTTLTYELSLEAPYLEQYRQVSGISGVINFNNDTSTIDFIYSDDSGLSLQYCLRVESKSAFSFAIVSDECQTASTGTLSYVITDYDSNYIATGYVKASGSPFYETVIDYFEIFYKDDWKKFSGTGLLLDGIFIMTFAVVGFVMAGIAGSIIFATSGMGIFGLIGFVPLRLVTYIGILIFAILLISRMRRKV